jgi:hypothetical protein
MSLGSFKAGDAPPVLSRLALIFRALLNETQSQSQIVTDTPNIKELGISTDIPLTEYRSDVVSTRYCLPPGGCVPSQATPGEDASADSASLIRSCKVV